MSKNSLTEKIKEHLNTRNIVFLLFTAVALILAYSPIRALYSSNKSEYYSHIALIPLVSIYLIYIKRKEIFAKVNYLFAVGVPVLLLGIALFLGGILWGAPLDNNNYASLLVFSIFIFINGAFILLYGMQAYKAALFPLLFLIFIVPIPTALMDRIIYFLQVGSTEFTNLLFMASGVPFVREGFVFHLPNISVEVAKQCSGIRSGMAIFIVATLAGYMFLKTYWKMIFLVICAVLIAMFKNGIRILTLSLLGNYVDPQILASSLHREGGTPFFIVALLLLAPILFFLRRSERKKDSS
ncbi:MAG: exosortase/archaeosortase family protein [Veillonellales bacterium]|jgi:exosortase